MTRPHEPCPCHSGRKYKKCCRLLHMGRAAPGPEALMRSRYAAYAIGEVRYVLETTDPQGPQHQEDAEAWRASALAFSEGTEFVGLEVEQSSAEGDRGQVTFVARLEQGGQDASFREVSRFVRRAGRWLYVEPIELEELGV